MGGHQSSRTIYTRWAVGGTVFDIYAGFDLPGLHYARRKNVNAYPDPQTGENTHISPAYLIDATPASIEHPEELR